LVLNRRGDATDRLLAYNVGAGFARPGEQTSPLQDVSTNEEWRKKSAIERLQYALKNGISDFIEEDVLQVLQEFSNPVEIIEGPLMAAMSEVGKQFGEGKLFLPQIVKSARVMKKAVAVLEPYIDASRTSASAGVSTGSTTAPSDISRHCEGGTTEAIQNDAGLLRLTARNDDKKKILLATVKGDVHDIGKNIAGVVLACNGYEIIDLGVMVDCETIVNAAIENNVGLIGLSGLITPSLDEMATVAKALQEKNINIPLVVGGASTSELHTAVYLNPLYDGGVYHAKDASHGAEIIRELMSGGQGNLFVEHTQKRYENLKTTYKNKQILRSAQDDIIAFDLSNITRQSDIQKLQNFPLENLVPLIDWRYFFHAWELKNVETLHATSLREDAEKMLQKIVDEKLLTANAAYGIFDGVCVFACTAGIGVDVLVEAFEKSGDTYSALLVQTLADRLAEAFAEYLNREKFSGKRIAVGYPSYPDHSKKKELFALIHATEITGIELTETFMMVPVASVCGLIFPQ